MSQKRAQTVISMKAAATLAAYTVVGISAANTVALRDTSTSMIFGVTTDDSMDGTGSSVAVCIAGTAKVLCGASVSAGSVVTVQTATGYAIEAAAVNTTTSAIPKLLGIALQAGSTNAVIEVALQINNIGKVAFA